jgi:hypothetical protein
MVEITGIKINVDVMSANYKNSVIDIIKKFYETADRNKIAEEIQN